MRQLIPPVFAALLLLALTGACNQGEEPQPSPTAQDLAPQAMATDTLDPAPRTELPVGVQIFEAEVETDALEQLRNVGASWARTRALWKVIEPKDQTPPVYNWKVTDWLFGDVSASGFRQVASVYANPSWAADSECGPVSEEHMDRYAALWTALVERYDGDGIDDAPNGAEVRYWQVSNEVDYDPSAAAGETDYGGCMGDDPAAYAEHQVNAWRAAKRADPDARIGFGPVAYDRFTAESAPVGWDAEPGPFVYDFTQRAIEHLYTAYADDPDLPFFDFVGMHNYNDNGHYWDSSGREEARELVGKVASFRQEQLALPGVFDLRGFDIMVSETGLASSPTDEYTERSEELQAMYVGQTMVRGQAAGVMAAIWYTARDNIFGDCAPPHWDWLTFGLMRSREYSEALGSRCPIHPWIGEYNLTDGPATPKPAMGALETVVDVFGGATFDTQLGSAETGDSAIEAYRFSGPTGEDVIAAWTTTGERLGKHGVEPVVATLAVGPEMLQPWTGSVNVMDHMGSWRELAQVDAEPVEVRLTQAPVYIRAGR